MTGDHRACTSCGSEEFWLTPGGTIECAAGGCRALAGYWIARDPRDNERAAIKTLMEATDAGLSDALALVGAEKRQRLTAALCGDYASPEEGSQP